MFKYKQNDIGQLRFSLRNAKEDSTMIRARITIKGQRMIYFLPAEYKVEPAWWDTKLGLAKTEAKTNPAVKGNPTLKNYLENVNSEIQRTQITLREIIANLQARNIPYTADLVKKELVIKLKPESVKAADNIPRDLVGYMTYYISLCEEGAKLNHGIKLADGSIGSYRSTVAVLRKYCTATRTKLNIDTLTIEFYHSFINYLNSSSHSRGKYAQSTVGKFLKNIKAVLRYAYKIGHTTNSIYAHPDFEILSARTEEIYLTDAELDILYGMALPKNKALVRDYFLISCYTGLRHSDLLQINDTHINILDRKITLYAIKTDTKTVIPLNSRVLEILNKYGGHMPPVPANATMNEQIKKICKDAGFTEIVNLVTVRGGERIRESHEKWSLVKCHSGRRTFSSNLSNKGMSNNDLMQLTGHSSEGNLRRYLRTSKDETADKLLNETEYFK